MAPDPNPAGGSGSGSSSRNESTVKVPAKDPKKKDDKKDEDLVHFLPSKFPLGFDCFTCLVPRKMFVKWKEKPCVLDVKF